jgi:H+-transporting ATPase
MLPYCCVNSADKAKSRFCLVLSSVTDIAIAATLAIFGILMTPLPTAFVAGTLAAAVAVAYLVDTAKLPVFGRLGIA